MISNAKYVHTNLIARDWKKLAEFYETVFGCKPVPPERDLSGQWLEKATNINNVSIQGIHLKLPGYGDGGPTLEIFQYSPNIGSDDKAVNKPGFSHIAFQVSDVDESVKIMEENGGRAVGEVVTLAVKGKGFVTFTYVRDPEGNIIELQKWAEGKVTIQLDTLY